MPDRRPYRNAEEFVFGQDWDSGHEYDLDWAREYLLPDLLQLHRDGQLGPVVADVGSGPKGISSLLPKGEGLKIIRADLVAPKEVTEDSFQFPIDLDNLGKLSFSDKKNLVGIRNWVEGEKGKPVVDTMILSSVLNYIDYKDVLQKLLGYLKQKGKLVVFNCPERGNVTHGHLFSPNRPKSNYEIISFLEGKGLEAKVIKFDDVDLRQVEKLGDLPKGVLLDDLIYHGHLSYIGEKQ